VIVTPWIVAILPGRSSSTRSMPFASIVVAPAPAPAIVRSLVMSRSPEALASSDEPVMLRVKWPLGRLTVSGPLPCAQSPPGPVESLLAALIASRSEHWPLGVAWSRVVVAVIVAPRAGPASKRTTAPASRRAAPSEPRGTREEVKVGRVTDYLCPLIGTVPTSLKPDHLQVPHPAPATTATALEPTRLAAPGVRKPLQFTIPCDLARYEL